MENEDLWINMGERLNMNPAKHPLIDPVLELLASMYTEEQAAVIADFPIGAHTVKQLAETLNRDEADLQRILDEMDENCTIFAMKNAAGEKEYSVIPFEFGLFEPRLIQGKKGDPKTLKHMELIKKIFAEEENAIRIFFDNAPEMAKKALSDPHLRYLPVEEIVPSDGSVILSEEKLSHILEQSESFCAVPCGCRRLAKLEGHECENTMDDDYVCIQTDISADWLVEKGIGKRLTKEEIMEKIPQWKEKGFLQLAGAFSGPGGFCNCCKCCCFHRQMGVKLREFGVKLAKNTFLAKIDDMDKCTGCGVCQEICPVDAITITDGKAVTSELICAGCGHCVTRCPEEIRSLVRIAEPELHDHEHIKVGLGY